MDMCNCTSVYVVYVHTVCIYPSPLLPPLPLLPSLPPSLPPLSSPPSLPPSLPPSPLCSTEDCQLKALVILAKGVHYLSSKQLQNVFAAFLLGEPGSADNHAVYRALLSSLDHLSEDICYATLHLFDALLGLANENVVLRLLEIGHVTSHVTNDTLRWKKCGWVEERKKVETLVNQ